MGKKIPKKIAGVSIPKVLRKNSMLKGLLGSAAGRQVMAESLVAAAGAAAAALVAVKSGAASKAGHELAKTGAALVEPGADTGKIIKKAVQDAATAMTDVLSKAAQAALNAEPQRRTSKPH